MLYCGGGVEFASLGDPPLWSWRDEFVARIKVGVQRQPPKGAKAA